MGKECDQNSIDVFLSFFKPAVALTQQRTDFHSLIVRCSDTDTIPPILLKMLAWASASTQIYVPITHHIFKLY